MFNRWLCWWEKGGGGDRDPGGGTGGRDPGRSPRRSSNSLGGWFPEDLSGFDMNVSDERLSRIVHK